MAETEQYLSSLNWMACFTAVSSSGPRRRYRISSLVQTVGGSVARSPEQTTSSDSSFCRFFSSTMTTSVAVQAPSAMSTSSIGPGALFDVRSESMVIVCPEGLVATNFCSPIHFTDAVCMGPPWPKDNRRMKPKRAAGILIHPASIFWFQLGDLTGRFGWRLGRRYQMQIQLSQMTRWLSM